MKDGDPRTIVWIKGKAHRLFDFVEKEKCPRCGGPMIIDGHEGRHWLLCMDFHRISCTETKEIKNEP